MKKLNTSDTALVILQIDFNLALKINLFNKILCYLSYQLIIIEFTNQLKSLSILCY